jgi:hypothetical protein
VRCVSITPVGDVFGGLLCYNGKVLHSFLKYKDNSDNSHYMYRERPVVGCPKIKNVLNSSRELRPKAVVKVSVEIIV